MQKRQKGASGISLIIMLAILGFAVYVGLQYVPQLIESSAVDTILDSIEQDYQSTPDQNVQQIRSAIDKQLSINEMRDMKDSFQISKYRGTITIKVNYERELNLGFKTKMINYEKSRVLD